MLFKDVLSLDDYVFSGKSLKESLPQHQLSSLTKGKCMPKAEAQPDERQNILLLPRELRGVSTSPPHQAVLVFQNNTVFTPRCSKCYTEGRQIFTFFSQGIKESALWDKTLPLHRVRGLWLYWNGD